MDATHKMTPGAGISLILLIVLTFGCREVGRNGDANTLAHDGSRGIVSTTQDDENSYTMTASGDVSFAHAGAVSCAVYEDELLVTFAHDDMLTIDYEMTVPGVTGAGAYDGTVVLSRSGRESQGTIQVDANVEEGGILPVLIADVSGRYEGSTGSGTLEGSFRCATDFGRPDEVAGTPATGYWIDYEISGDFEVNRREGETLVCGMGDDGFSATSMGAWTIHIETGSVDEAQQPARFRIVPPSHLHDRMAAEDVRNMYRIEGEGTVSIQQEGKDAYGFPLVNVHFAADQLTTVSGLRIGLQGRLYCAAMTM